MYLKNNRMLFEYPLTYGFQRQKSSGFLYSKVVLGIPSFLNTPIPNFRPTSKGSSRIIRLSITAGCGHFHFDNVNNETIVPAGNIVLYRPKELQKYEYYGEDKTEVYCSLFYVFTFTGSNI